MSISGASAARVAILAALAILIPLLHAQPIVVTRGEVTLMVEPYAENVVRVSISRLRESATDAPLEELGVYPGAHANFDLYSDDGTTYAYECGALQIPPLH